MRLRLGSGALSAGIALAAVLALAGCVAGPTGAARSPTTTGARATRPPTEYDLPLAQTVVADLHMATHPTAQFLLDVGTALAKVRVVPSTVLRWAPESGAALAGSRFPAPAATTRDGPAVPEAGLPGQGLTGTGYLPGLGAGLRVTSYHLADQAPLKANYCAAMMRAPRGDTLRRPPELCRQTAITGGVLAVIDSAAQTGMTEALVVTGHSIVRVTTFVMDTPAAQRVKDRHPVNLPAVSALAQDPRLRW